MGKLKESRPRSGAGILLALLAAAACFGLAACNIKDPFEGYYDSTVNFISASGLTEATIDRSTAGYQTNAVWTWAWRGATDADDMAGGFNYMNLTDQGTIDAAGETAGIAAASQVYRLELVNLVSGGDFERYSSIVELQPAWEYDFNADTDLTLIGSGSFIHGQSLYIETGASSWISFSLASLKDYSATVPHNYSLLANCYFLAGGFQINTAFDGDAIAEIPSGTVLQIGKSGIIGSDGYKLFFGSKTLNQITIDDMRAYRSDLLSSLRLLLRPSDTAPSLADGYFEFTVWVRKPADLRFVTESGASASAADEYAASEVSLFMTNITGGKGSAQGVFSITDGTWTKLSLKENAGGNFEGIDPASADQAMELAIYPCDYQHPSPATIEIAQPELHFYLNGY